MLGLILLYFIGKTFYNLAALFEKSPWLYAVLGVVSYYAGTMIGGILIYSFFLFVDSPGAMGEMPDMAVNFLALPFGLLSCWLFYRILKKNWESLALSTQDDILDDEML